MNIIVEFMILFDGICNDIFIFVLSGWLWIIGVNLFIGLMLIFIVIVFVLCGLCVELLILIMISV